ncbi:MAG TPA: GntR family transcriptional regulator [Methylomirabilota bacterium]|nr:GntR family transcriptional regulator [Methylomirabilota bacterium]
MAGEVVDRIRKAIVCGDLSLGQDLSERQLAESLGVSKTPVREALAQLRLEGLVRIYPQRGVTVFTLSASEIRDICELRQALEVAALRYALERHPDRLTSGLARVVEAMANARRDGDARGYLEADTAYHEVFFEACGNRYLEETYALHIGKIAALRTHLARKPMHTQKSYDEHVEMLKLLRAGDNASALAVLDRHIDRTKSTYAEEIEDIAAADGLRD